MHKSYIYIYICILNVYIIYILYVNIIYAYITFVASLIPKSIPPKEAKAYLILAVLIFALIP